VTPRFFSDAESEPRTVSPLGDWGRPDLSVLAARLDEFDCRLREVKSRSHLLEVKTAAYILLAAEGAGPRPAPAAATRGVRLAIDLSPASD
jgi:hypothetical protein